MNENRNKETMMNDENCNNPFDLDFNKFTSEQNSYNNNNYYNNNYYNSNVSNNYNNNGNNNNNMNDDFNMMGV